jgi:disulfide bond formation protein DsbB
MTSHPLSTIPTQAHDQRRQEHAALGLALGVVLGAVVLWGLALAGGVQLSAWNTPNPERDERNRMASLKPGENLDVAMVAHGKHTFGATCGACHGADGRGVRGTGKDLVESLFVRGRDDAQLLAFVKQGRPVTDPLNTTRVPMPPKGGYEQLTDEDLVQVIAYVRSLQDPRRVWMAGVAGVEGQILAAEAKADAERSAARAAKLAAKAAAKPAEVGASGQAAEEEYDTETIAYGGELFMSSCSTCHGKDAKGLPKNGKDLVHSQFVKGQSNENLIAFIKRGRDPGDPANTTKIAMPPKGGNPAMNDEKIEAVVAYLRSLQKAAGTNP